jgi:2-oxoglutarate ferredoxin oxidoreductase subunit alpha
MVLGDGTIGQMMEPVVVKEVTPKTYDNSWAAVGWEDKSRPRAVINSLSLDPNKLEKMNDHLQEKYRIIEEKEVLWETYNAEDCDILIVAFGTTARSARSVINEYTIPNHKVGLFCPLTVWPFPYKQLKEAAKGKKAVLVAEMNAGQMIDDVRLALGDSVPIHFYGRTGGVITGVEELYDNVKKIGEVL